jgi:hypothetical protein
MTSFFARPFMTRTTVANEIKSKVKMFGYVQICRSGTDITDSYQRHTSRFEWRNIEKQPKSHVGTCLVLIEKRQFKANFPADETDFHFKSSQEWGLTILLLASLCSVHFTSLMGRSRSECLLVTEDAYTLCTHLVYVTPLLYEVAKPGRSSQR